MKKNTKIHIPIDSETKERLRKKADEVGLSLSQFCLIVLSRARIKDIQIEIG